MIEVGIVAACYGDYVRFLPGFEDACAALDPPAATVTIVGDAEAQTAWSGRGQFVLAPELGNPFRQAEACNRAVAATATDWIRMIGVDDLLLPGVLAHVDALADDADVIATDAELLRGGRLTGQRTNRPTTALMLKPTPGRQPLDASAFYRRSLWERAPYREEMEGASDVALWIDFARLGARFAATRLVGVRYQVHSDSMWHSRPTGDRAALRSKLNDLRAGRAPGEDGRRTVSVAVMAHPERERFVPYLIDRLDRDPAVIWDERNDRWHTGRRALLAYDPACSHHIVVQDDALVTRDLAAGTERLLAHVPEDAPVGLYFGKVRPHGPLMSALARRATEAGSSFIIAPGPLWGVAVCLPTAAIPAIVACGDEAADLSQYDLKIARWFQRERLSCYYTLPSLADHRVEDNPSLLRRGAGRGRHAHRFAGEMASALEVAWEGGILDGRRSWQPRRQQASVYVVNESDRTITRGGYTFLPGEETAVVVSGTKLREVRACRALRIY